MALSYKAKQKLRRKQDRDTQKIVHEAAQLAVDSTYFLAIYAAKQVFKERASNPKLEAMILEMRRIWKSICEGKVSEQMVCDSIEVETGIRVDLKTHEMLNMRRKKYGFRQKV